LIPIKTEEEIELMRKAADLLVRTLKAIESHVKPGISTKRLDQIAEETIRLGGGTPSFKGYRGYPASICVSIDDEVVHGIPGNRIIQNEAIVSIDIGVLLNGFHSDAARTYAVGELDLRRKVLIESTKAALYRGIKKCRAGNRLQDISHAIQSYVETQKFQVVRDLVGHGIGRSIHEEPQIPNYGAPHQGPKLKPGMVFAIEPMVNMGGYEVKVMEDGWTIKTRDGLPSAHFEHTVLVTEGKPEILTRGIEDSQSEEIYG
jgi:methionyl aminopeptidase